MLVGSLWSEKSEAAGGCEKHYHFRGLAEEKETAYLSPFTQLPLQPEELEFMATCCCLEHE